MAKSLTKREKINLAKASDSLRRVRAVLSWQTPQNVFPKYDLDISAFLLGSNAKMLDEDSLVFYNQEAAPDGSVWKTEDEREGGSEELIIDITKLSPAVAEISLVVTIHKAEQRRQSFDQVKGSMIEIFNMDTGEKITEFKLADIDAGSTALQVGSFYQAGDEFTFQAIGASYKLDLAAFIDGYSE